MTLRSLLLLCFLMLFSSPADTVPLVLGTPWLLLLLLKAVLFVGSSLILDTLLICVPSSVPSLLVMPFVFVVSVLTTSLFVVICFNVSLVCVLIITVASQELVVLFVLLFVSVVTALELLGLEAPLWYIFPLATAKGEMNSG